MKPKAGLNSLDLHASGQKVVEFKDGLRIVYNPTNDRFANTLFGTLQHILIGRCDFRDDVNNIEGWFEIGNVRRKPKDYLIGAITKNGVQVAEMSGSYAGFLEFDGKRYWDQRDVATYPCLDLTKTQPTTDKKGSLPLLLPSDSERRTDLTTLKLGDVDAAEVCKNELENV